MRIKLIVIKFLLNMVVLHKEEIIVLHLMLIICTESQKAEQKHCPDDVYDIKLNYGKTISIIWMDTRYISQPLCLNSDYEVLNRKCNDNGEWEERKNCNYFSNFCPNTLNYEDLDYCYVTTEKTIGNNNGCEIPGNLYDPFDKSFERYMIPNQKYWIPHITIEKDNLFVHYTFDMKELYSETARIFNKCPVILNEIISYEDCNNLNHNFCVYKPDDFLYDCPDNCLPAGLNTTQCYCRCDLNNNKTAITEFYHQILMQKKLTKELDTTKICVVDVVNNQTPILTLNFKNRKHRLYLTVTFYENLYPINGQLVQCFKDGYKLEIIKIKNLNKVSKYLDKKRLRRNTLVYNLEITEMPAEYFCIARKKPDLSIIQTDYIVAYKKFKGYIYTMKINMTDNLTHALENYFSKKSLKLHAMRVFKNRDGINTYIYHVKDDYSNYPSEYYNYFARGFPRQYPSVKLIYFRCIDKCLSESRGLLNSTIRWPTTSIGNNAYSSDVCLQANGLPLIRRCVGNFLQGAYWDYVNGSCSWTRQKSDITKQLEKFVSNNDSYENIIEQVTNISRENLQAFDIFLLTNIVERHLVNMSAEFLNIVSNLMRIERNELQLSQIVFKSTDIVLNDIDILLTDNNQQFPDVNKKYYYLEKRENFILQISYPFVTNITGLAAYGNKNDTFNEFNVTTIERNVDRPDFLFDNLQIATYIPDKLLEEITETMTIEEKTKLQIFVMIFFNDSLFNSNNETQRIDGSVVSVLIPQLKEDYFNYSVPIYFNATTNASCAFWDYNVETGINSKWSNLGNDFTEFLNDTNILHCDFMHLTHFGFLITSPLTHDLQAEYVYNMIEHDYVLDVITYIGCGLSLIGIIIIFITTILFEKFRKKASTKILLQISIAIICEILMLQISGNIKGYITCTVIGFLLHYIVLSKFCWMLITAYLQYNRFVKVFAPPPQRIILKSFIFGWIVPLIISLIVVLVTNDGYEASRHNFCYPKGLSLYIGVFLPITIIVLANLIIFCLIMINVIRPKMPQGVKQHKEQKLQINLGVLLFFLLGIPWIFGILAEIITTPIIHLIFMYLFCLLVTLQGFVIFIFYIVLDKDTRRQLCVKKP